MKKVKSIVSVIAFAAALFLGIMAIRAGIAAGKDWINRFPSELDRFFGEGNWSCVEKETKSSRVLKSHVSGGKNNRKRRTTATKYQNWYIEFENRYGEKDIYCITNHTLKANHSKRWLFDPRRYSDKQGFIMELMELSFEQAGEEILKTFFVPQLSEAEAACFDISVGYYGETLESEIVDKVWEQPWFTVNGVTAKDYLSCDLYDFHLNMNVDNNRLEQLTDAEYQHIVDTMPVIEQQLLDAFGEDASFIINSDSEIAVEYRDGVKQ